MTIRLAPLLVCLCSCALLCDSAAAAAPLQIDSSGSAEQAAGDTGEARRPRRGAAGAQDAGGSGAPAATGGSEAPGAAEGSAGSAGEAGSVAPTATGAPDAAPAAPSRPAPTGDPVLHTYPQQAWGKPCGRKERNEAACLRDDHFAALFPNGLVLGDRDGVDGDELFALVFTAPDAIGGFLPKEGEPSVLSVDAANPRHGLNGTGGGLAGRLLAAKLNAAFNDAGLMDDHSGHRLSDMVLERGPAEVRGARVADVLRIADDILAGVYEPLGGMRKTTVDIDGDGTPDATPYHIYNALETINESFESGRGGRALAVVETSGDASGATAGSELADAAPAGGADGPAPEGDVAARDAGTDGAGGDPDGHASDDGAAPGERDPSGLAAGTAGDVAAAQRARAELDLRTYLVRPPDALASDVRGTLRVRADPTEGRQRVEVVVQRADTAHEHELFVETAPSSGRYVRVAPLALTLMLDEDGGDEEERVQALLYRADTQRGDPLPGGVASVAELAGRRLEVRSGTRVVLSAVVPAAAPVRSERAAGG